MTSKNLFFNISLVWDAMKKKIWFFILSCVGFFFILPVAITIVLQDSHLYVAPSKGEYVNSLIDTLMRFFSGYNPLTSSFIILLAFIMGIAFFAYLHSKRQTDFYVSLPISSRKLFLVNYFAGAATVIIPFVVFYLSAIAIAGLFGDLQYVRKLTLLYGLVYPICLFFAVYSLAVLAGVLTGNKVIHGCVAVYFCSVLTAAVFEYTSLMSSFFKSYVSGSNLIDTLFMWSSPITRHLYYLSNEAVNLMATLIVFSVSAIVITIISVLLYNKRQNENVGKAMAFSWFTPLVKYPLLVLGAIGLALLFYYMAPDKNVWWLMFGAIVGGILISRGLEVLMSFDIKAIKKHWLNLIVSLAVVGCILSIFVFDLTKYDEYLPSKSEIQTVNIDISGLNVYGDGYYGEKANSDYYSLRYLSDLTNDKEIEAALKIADNGIKYINNNGSIATGTAVYDPYFSGENLSDNRGTLVNQPQTTVLIKYTLKNGQTKTRSYQYVKKSQTINEVKTLLTSQEFKDGNLSYLRNKNLDVESIYYYNTGFNIDSTMITAENKKKIIDAYKKDANNLSLADMETKRVLGAISFIGKIFDNGVSELSVASPIYETYENTLAVLKDVGYDINDYGVLQPEYITSIKKEFFNDHGGLTDQSETLPVQQYSEILKNTFSDNELVNNYFLGATQPDESNYYIVGVLPVNSSPIASYRSSSQYWE